MAAFEPCLDPNCKGCRWYASHQKAIDARREAKSQQKAPVGPGNLDDARLLAERYERAKA